MTDIDRRRDAVARHRLRNAIADKMEHRLVGQITATLDNRKEVAAAGDRVTGD